MIYGATGYTGRLFAKHLLARNISPVLAGRGEDVTEMAQELGCTARIFPVDEAADHLEGISVLVNLAGPFVHTQAQLIEACLETGTHYLDIAGEVPEVKAAFAFQEQAQEKGITIVPAAGFGVAPTDIAAKRAAAMVEHATHLTIAYATDGGASRGTLRTVLQDIHQPGVQLKEGAYIEAAPAQSEMPLTIKGKAQTAVYNPWRADLFTAFHSTGIPTIETYSVFPGFAVRMMQGKLLWLRNLMLKRLLKLLPVGPSAKQLARGSTFVRAKVHNAAGQAAQVTVEGPEAYVFTMECLGQIAELVRGGQAPAGVLSPSDLGVDWLGEIDGVRVTEEVLGNG